MNTHLCQSQWNTFGSRNRRLMSYDFTICWKCGCASLQPDCRARPCRRMRKRLEKAGGSEPEGDMDISEFILQATTPISHLGDAPGLHFPEQFGSGEHMECPLIHRQMNLQRWRWKCSSELFPSSSVRKTYAGSSTSLALSHPTWHLPTLLDKCPEEKKKSYKIFPLLFWAPHFTACLCGGHIPLASQQPFVTPTSSSFSCLSAPHGVSLWPETCIPEGWSLQESRTKQHLSWPSKLVQLPSGKMTFKWNIYKPKFNSEIRLVQWGWG